MDIIRHLLQLYIYVIIADIIMSYVPQARENVIGEWVHKAADATLRPVREMLPQDLPLDPSPMIVIIVVQILMYLF